MTNVIGAVSIIHSLVYNKHYNLQGLDVEDVTFSKKHIPGDAASSILDEIRRDFDLVIMGTTGHGAIGGAIVGSVTQQVNWPSLTRRTVASITGLQNKLIFLIPPFLIDNNNRLSNVL